MKVYSCPSELPEPKPDFARYDHAAEIAKETQHQAQVKEWLVAQGYTGKNTGEIVSFSVADGRAIYMFADGRSPALIHLRYGDGYQYQHARVLPKAEILRLIQAEKKLAALFKDAQQTQALEGASRDTNAEHQRHRADGHAYTHWKTP